MKGLGEVYYNPNYLANILSSAEVDRKGFCISLDTDIEPAFIVRNTCTRNKKIIQRKSGSHYYDIIANSTKNEYTMFQTVDQNKDMFNKKELTLADKAIKLY